MGRSRGLSSSGHAMFVARDVDILSLLMLISEMSEYLNCA